MSTPFASMGSQSVTFAKAYRAEAPRRTTRSVRLPSGPRRRVAHRLRIRRRLLDVTRPAPYAHHHPLHRKES